MENHTTNFEDKAPGLLRHSGMSRDNFGIAGGVSCNRQTSSEANIQSLQTFIEITFNYR